MNNKKEEDFTSPGKESTGDLTSSSKENDGPPVSSTSSLTKIFLMAKPELHMLVVAFVLMVGAEATGLIVPLILANAYDTLVDEDIPDEERMQDINYYMTVVILVFAAGIVAGWLRASILGVIGERMVARLRYQLYGSILKQEIGFFDEHKSGELVSRLGSDTTLLQMVLSQSLPEFILGVIKVIVTVSLMFYISTTLAGVSFGSVILTFMVAMPLDSCLVDSQKHTRMSWEKLKRIRQKPLVQCGRSKPLQQKIKNLTGLEQGSAILICARFGGQNQKDPRIDLDSSSR